MKKSGEISEWITWGFIVFIAVLFIGLMLIERT